MSDSDKKDTTQGKDDQSEVAYLILRPRFTTPVHEPKRKKLYYRWYKPKNSKYPRTRFDNLDS